MPDEIVGRDPETGQPIFRAKWAQGIDFAEIAKTLGIKTDEVIAMQAHEGGYLVLYAHPQEDPDTIWRAFLRRDDEGILRWIDGPHEVSGLMAEIRRALEEKGPPPETAPGTLPTG